MAKAKKGGQKMPMSLKEMQANMKGDKKSTPKKKKGKGKK